MSQTLDYAQATGQRKWLPPIDWMYWLMIISATTIGETGGDLISMTLHTGYALSSIILVGLFVVALAVSLCFRVQHGSVYWTVIILTSTAGTTMADYVTRNLAGTPEEPSYGLGSAVIVGALAVIFVTWKLTARDVDIHRPLSRVTELLYWAAILVSSTLGTAFGDFLADDTGLTFGTATAVLIAVLAVLAAVALFTRLPRTPLYWLAIIITHPLGATAGDFLTKGKDEGGLQLGTVVATALLTAVFLAIVALRYTWGRNKPQPR